MISRRALFALGAGGLLLPRRAARAAGPERRFLFILANGGWDPTYVFTPTDTLSGVDGDPEGVSAEVNGIRFVDAESRPAVRSFFESWGDRVAVINGLEVRSVTHERCKRILLTGGSADGGDDWPTQLAARSLQDPLLPHLVVYGPAYSARYTDRVVRVGDAGQLGSLLDGSALSQSGVDISRFDADLDALVDQKVASRAGRWAGGATRGQRRAVGEGYLEALATLDKLKAESLSLASTYDGCMRNIAADAAVAFTCFEKGLSRCAMLRDDGWCSVTWDSHTDNQNQATHFQYLFAYLDTLMADLATRTSVTGGPLSEEVTVVVLSEMGRQPVLNSTLGKDHWTYTSLMLMGAGVRGGQVIGEMDQDYTGRPVDLATGEATDSGTSLLPNHLGATLLAMADIDPGEVIEEEAEPITAVMG